MNKESEVRNFTNEAVFNNLFKKQKTLMRRSKSLFEDEKINNL